jgi:hypothetical protein
VTEKEAAHNFIGIINSPYDIFIQVSVIPAQYLVRE